MANNSDGSDAAPPLQIDYVPPSHDPYAALRVGNFLLYTFSFLMLLIGAQIQNLAFGWELYERTNSKMALGWYGLVQAVPMFIFTLPAGQLADWMDRKKIILSAQFVSCLCASGLAFVSFNGGSLQAMFVCIGLNATAAVFVRPARGALLPQILSRPVFNNAVMWSNISFQVAQVAGPAAGGILIKFFGVKNAYIFNAGCMIVGLAAMAFVKAPKTVGEPKAVTLKGLAAGLNFVFRTKVILAALTLDMFGVLFGGATYLLPVFAKDILHVDEKGLGWMTAAGAIGGGLTAALLAHLPPMKNAGRALLWAVTGFGFATVIFGISTSFWLSISMLFLIGALDSISVVVRHTLVQVLAPETMRGRISAVNSMFIGASNELGGFESGLTAFLFGAVGSVVAGGFGTVLVVLSVSLLWPQLGKVKSLHDLQPEPEQA